MLTARFAPALLTIQVKFCFRILALLKALHLMIQIGFKSYVVILTKLLSIIAVSLLVVEY